MEMRGQTGIWGVMIGGSILLLIVGMVLALTYIFIAQTDAIVGGLNTTYGSGSDIITSLAGTTYTLSTAHPIITSVKFRSYATTSNTTIATVGNTTIPVDVLNSSLTSDFQANLTYCYNNTNQSNTSVALNGNTLGYVVMDEDCKTYASIQTYLVGTRNNFTTYKLNGSLVIKNVSIVWAYYTPTTGYTQNNDKVTTTANGTFKFAYNYPTSGMNSDNAVDALGKVQDAMDIFPQWLVMTTFGLIFVGMLSLVMGIVMFVKQGGLVGGGIQ